MSQAKIVGHVGCDVVEVECVDRLGFYDGPQWIRVHAKDRCAGQPCPIHNPSDHHMVTWDQRWRDDRKIMERVCEHGIGHVDPDDITTYRVHGCDGCCQPPTVETP